MGNVFRAEALHVCREQRSCYDCGTPTETAEIGGRTSYSCPRCQAR